MVYYQPQGEIAARTSRKVAPFTIKTDPAAENYWRGLKLTNGRAEYYRSGLRLKDGEIVHTATLIVDYTLLRPAYRLCAAPCRCSTIRKRIRANIFTVPELVS